MTSIYVKLVIYRHAYFVSFGILSQLVCQNELARRGSRLCGYNERFEVIIYIAVTSSCIECYSNVIGGDRGESVCNIDVECRCLTWDAGCHGDVPIGDGDVDVEVVVDSDVGGDGAVRRERDVDYVCHLLQCLGRTGVSRSPDRPTLLPAGHDFLC